MLPHSLQRWIAPTDNCCAFSLEIHFTDVHVDALKTHTSKKQQKKWFLLIVLKAQYIQVETGMPSSQKPQPSTRLKLSVFCIHLFLLIGTKSICWQGDGLSVSLTENGWWAERGEGWRGSSWRNWRLSQAGFEAEASSGRADTTVAGRTIQTRLLH